MQLVTTHKHMEKGDGMENVRQHFVEMVRMRYFVNIALLYLNKLNQTNKVTDRILIIIMIAQGKN